jgi:hypothetical protein
MDFPTILGAFRDFIIIVFGLVWIVAGAIVAAIAWYAYRFIRSLPGRAERVIAPSQELLGQTRQAVATAGEGAQTAREAIGFVSEKAVLPTITLLSAMAGIRTFVRALITGPTGPGNEVKK